MPFVQGMSHIMPHHHGVLTCRFPHVFTAGTTDDKQWTWSQQLPGSTNRLLVIYPSRSDEVPTTQRGHLFPISVARSNCPGPSAFPFGLFSRHDEAKLFVSTGEQSPLNCIVGAVRGLVGVERLWFLRSPTRRCYVRWRTNAGQKALEDNGRAWKRTSRALAEKSGTIAIVMVRNCCVIYSKIDEWRCAVGWQI